MRLVCGFDSRCALLLLLYYVVILYYNWAGDLDVREHVADSVYQFRALAMHLNVRNAANAPGHLYMHFGSTGSHRNGSKCG